MLAKLLLFIIFCSFCIRKVVTNDLAVLLLTQPWPYELAKAEKFEENFLASAKKLGWNGTLLQTHLHFENRIGGWSFWPLLGRISQPLHDSHWLLIVDPFTKVNWEKLNKHVEKLNPNEDVFEGKALKDDGPVIIHHFDGFQSETKIAYPDFSSGVLLSVSLVRKIIDVARQHDRADFTIDAKYEASKFIYDHLNVQLKDSPIFCLSPSQNCIVTYEAPKYLPTEPGCGNEISKENVFYAVKTYHEYHKTRVVVVKRTWAKEVKFIEFFSDQEDYYIPTVHLNVTNTASGHCTKTLAIIKHYLEHEELKQVPWLVIADDDTLLSPNRLHKMLNCLPSNIQLILGERYGFGYDWEGVGGYDYPTGGAGMVFTRDAARHLAFACECPQIDSPDDMIIGMCARRSHIPILHSPAFHQAQRTEYNEAYRTKLLPVSFHKHENIDPYEEYINFLYEAESNHDEL